MVSRDEARTAKNAYIASLGGILSLVENDIGGVGIIEDQHNDWYVRVILPTRNLDGRNVPREVEGVEFYATHIDGKEEE